MLSSANSGKYLSAEWACTRAEGMADRTSITADERTWTELADTDGTMLEDSYKIDTVPIDPLTEPKKDAIDIRTNPKRGF